MKMSRGMMGWLLLAGLAVVLVVLLTSTQNQARKIDPVEFMNKAREGQFENVIVKSRRITGIAHAERGEQGPTRRQERFYFAIHPEQITFYVRELKEIEQVYDNDSAESFLLPFLVTWGPLILIAMLLYFFVFRRIGSAGGGPGMLGNFGRSRHRVTTKEHSNVTLDDVAGINEAKDELGEVIEFLKNPKKFQRLGGRVPRGVLLIGSPGCGKTLLARAIAGEADVPFFSISGSDFVEMFVGVGASRVRDLFKQAKDSSPCIIFLDEIDAVGRKRGSGMSSGGHDEREQTLNAILVEMDGFESSDQVIVIAATNRADVLDPALTRPGRFDRQIHVPLPDIRGRVEILKVHARRVKMNPEVNLERLARGTPMFSGADLAAIINEAAIGATLQAKEFVDQDDLEEARDKVKWGRARKSHKIEEDEKKIIAYHEAGHAVVTYYSPDAEPLHKVTIIPRGPALGVTFMLPEKDRHIHTRNQLLAQLRITFGGRIAEEIFCDDISSGAAMDIRQASGIVRAMVTEWGMSDRIGFQLLGFDEGRNPWEQPDRVYSEETARVIDDEIKKLIDHTYGESKTILEEHHDELIHLAEALLKYETLSLQEVEMVMRGEKLSRPTVSDLLKAEAESDNKPRPADPADDTAVGDDATGAMPSPA
ncbi:MAG: hypothetical protein CMJ18_25535 [Phycisphaeraceae bacterium]|nr:hypothetical protein [Phycisphaeraceae bacterium]